VDSLTQIVLGAAVGEAILGRKVGNKAILWGAVAGTIPDLDVLTNFFTDELTATEMHRGFSHSILFSVLFAPVFGWLVSKLHRKAGVGWKGWAWLMFGGLFTHPLLDAHTNWGTSLFWPLEYKVAYNNIFIIDPVYTIPFMVCVIWAMVLKRDNPKRKKINRLGIVISSTYMVLTLISKAVGYSHFIQSLEKQGIEYTRMTTNPTAFNSILWVATVETEDQFLLGYYSLFDGNAEVTFIPFDKNHDWLGEMQDEELTQRIIALAREWYTVQKEGDKIYINDLRFGQMKMGDDPHSFPFIHELWYEDGVLKAKQLEPDPSGMGEALAETFERIGGK